jgi:guanine nucleotide-binding protein alpha-1 subunit
VSGVVGASGRRVLQEFSINSSNGWKSALDKIRNRDHHYSRSSRENVRQKTLGMSLSSLPSFFFFVDRSNAGEEDDLPDEAADVLASCRDDIKALWEDSVVKELLGRRKTRIEDGAGL